MQLTHIDHQEILSVERWLDTNAGQYIKTWEQNLFDQWVPNLFGFQAIQLGMPSIEGLRENRIAHQYLLNPHPNPLKSVHLIAHFNEIPIASESIDLVVMPHTLEMSADPHACLREVERILVPEGRVIITGFTSKNLLRMGTTIAEKVFRHPETLPLPNRSLSIARVKDWLILLGLQLETGQFGCWRPALRNQNHMQRLAWLEAAGERWWPRLGALYALKAVKRHTGLRLVGPLWVKGHAPARQLSPIGRVQTPKLSQRQKHEPS